MLCLICLGEDPCPSRRSYRRTWFGIFYGMLQESTRLIEIAASLLRRGGRGKDVDGLLTHRAGMSRFIVVI